jgi:hypothetical protein
MNKIAKIVMVFALVHASLSLMKTNYGDMYDYFKENSLGFDEDDLHMLADSFYINSHFQEADKAGLLDKISNKISNATNQTADIGKLISSTSNVISTVKTAFGQVTNPGSLLKSGVTGMFGKLFGRNLQAEAVGQVVSNLESTISEAKTKQQSITSSLGTANKFVDFLRGVGSLFSGNTSGFVSGVKDKMSSWLKWNRRLLEDCDYNHHLFLEGLTSKFSSLAGNQGVKDFITSKFSGQPAANEVKQTGVEGSGLASKLKGVWGFLRPGEKTRVLEEVVAANPPPSFEPTELNKVRVLFAILASHLEHLAERGEQVSGRHRRTLFELRAIKERRLRVARSAKDTLSYLNSVDEKSINFDTVEHHMWDLIQDGGLWGKGYLRGVETLKCILLHRNCPQTVVKTTVQSNPVYFGTDEQVSVKTGSSNALIAHNVIDQEGTDNFAGAGVIDKDYQGIIQEKIESEPLSVDNVVTSIQKTIVPDQTKDVIVQTDHFNPSLGNEGIIIQNESEFNTLPPVSDVVDGSLLHTVIGEQPVQLSSDVTIPGVAVETTDGSPFVPHNTIVKNSVFSGVNDHSNLNQAFVNTNVVENVSNTVAEPVIHNPNTSNILYTTNVTPQPIVTHVIDHTTKPADLFIENTIAEPLVVTNPNTGSVIYTTDHVLPLNADQYVSNLDLETRNVDNLTTNSIPSSTTTTTTTVYKNGIPVETNQVTSNDDSDQNE